MPRLVAALALALVGSACAPKATPPPDFAEALAAYRAEVEAEVAAPTGPLSAIASHYVQGDRTIGVRVHEGEVITTDRPDDAPVVLTIAGDRITCARGCSDAAVVLDGAAEIALPPFVLMVGPQAGALRIVVHDPNAPARKDFAGLTWLPADPRAWVPGRIVAATDVQHDPLQTSRGTIKPLTRAGTIEARLADGTAISLLAYESQGQDALLVPFADETNTASTYPAGRYLDVPRPAAGEDAVILDFNRAQNPWCAYSEHYNCPIPPPENRLPVAIAAGQARVH